ncbi:hypothetical protein HMI55_006296 [Coelomomyces lativittatus]|nr:hypothetical protein HMI55_006296 [Coelomomyces lativittatus]
MTVVYITKGSIPSNVEVFLSQSNFMITEVRSVPNIVVLKNRLPKYNADMRTYCLNFNGRVTLPSVKNFQLSIFDESDVQLQFGRVGKDHFSMDVSHPLPLYMAFAICLSSFDAVEKV